MLASFLSFLQKNGLVRIGEMSKEDEDGFQNRMKAQKYVFLASRFGLTLNYDFNSRMYGPYSTQLVNECFDMGNDFNKDMAKPLPQTFDGEGFLRLVQGRDHEWLIIAGTILHMRPKFDDIKALLDQLEYTEPKVTRDYIEGVLADLQKNRLVDLDPVYNP